LIAVTGPIWLWTGDDRTWHFITVPPELSDEIRAHAFASPRGFRSAKVEAHIDEIIWRTSVFPMKDGGYILPIKAEVRRRAGIAEGDEITVELEVV